MNDFRDMFNQFLEIQVNYFFLSILAHVGLQTLINHNHRMKADREHTKQLDKIEKRVKMLQDRLER